VTFLTATPSPVWMLVAALGTISTCISRDLQGRKVFKVFNQDFIVSEQYNVTKELGQGAYGL
jgi:hypothetical protein